jgi:hypothetical protein
MKKIYGAEKPDIKVYIFMLDTWSSIQINNHNSRRSGDMDDRIKINKTNLSPS